MYTMIEQQCAYCGKRFMAPLTKVKAGKYKYCSPRCGRLGNVTPMLKRFWDKVDDSGGPDACWPWTAGKCAGYGIISIDGRSRRANRVAYELVNGPIPDGMFVCHHCDNKSCCNPAHLYAGSPKDNHDDAVECGAIVFRKHPFPPSHGEKNVKAKLSNADVRTIRSLYTPETRTPASDRALADRFDVSPLTIYRVIVRKIWTHID